MAPFLLTRRCISLIEPHLSFQLYCCSSKVTASQQHSLQFLMFLLYVTLIVARACAIVHSLPETTRRREARVKRSSCLCVRLNSVFELPLLSYRVLQSLIINRGSCKKLFSVLETLDSSFPRQESSQCRQM